MGKTTEVTRVIIRDCYYGYSYPLPSRYMSSILATDDEKWAVLATIGIERDDTTTPLRAWRDAVADASGIDRAQLDPAKGGALDLCFSDSDVRKFVFYLA